MATLTGRWRFIEGLGEDMLGYIFPRSNAVGVPDGEQPESGRHRPLRLRALGRRRGRGRGRGRPPERRGSSPFCRRPTRFEQVQVGRYVWSDGTLHRDPTGTGRHGCDATNAVFTPAPDGGAVGVWVLPPASASSRRASARSTSCATRRSPRAAEPALPRRERPARGGAEHADARHQRGKRRHIWVDVFPDTTGLTTLPPR